MKSVDVGVQVGYFRKGRVVKGKKGPPLCEEVRSIKSLILLCLSALGEKREGEELYRLPFSMTTRLLHKIGFQQELVIIPL